MKDKEAVYIPLRADESQPPVLHYLYAMKHKLKMQDDLGLRSEDQHRTLFIMQANLLAEHTPIWHSLAKISGSKIDRVVVPSSKKGVYVVMKNAKHLKQFLGFPWQDHISSLPTLQYHYDRLYDDLMQSVHSWGRKSVLYEPIAEEEVLAQAKDIMDEMDIEEQQRLKALEKESLVDEDGFTIVRSKRKKDVLSLKERQVKRIKTEDDYVVEDLYRHQRKERLMNELQILKEQFEEDKQRIKKMKENRTFKPF